MNLKHTKDVIFRSVLIIAFLLLYNFSCNAQSDTVLVISDTSASAKPVKKKDTKPRKATIMSALLPGLGQVYNKKYWKLPILYGMGGLIGYFYSDNNNYYRVYKLSYEDAINLKNPTISADYVRKAPIKYPKEFKKYAIDSLSSAQIKHNRDYYRRNRDLNLILMTGLYLLNLLDAHVDAQLRNFDVSDNLAICIEPRMNVGINYGLAPGICLNLKFKK